MDVTISLPDDFADRLKRCGISPEDYVKLLFSEAMRKARARELKSRPEDTQKFLDESAAEAKAKMEAEMLEDEAEAKIEALRMKQEERDAAAKVAVEQPAASPDSAIPELPQV